MRPPSRFLAVLCCLFGVLLAREAAAQLMPTLHDDSDTQDAHYRRNTALFSAATLTTVAVNTSDHAPGWVGAAGFVGGTLQVVYGTRIRSTHATSSMINYFVGGAAVLTSLSALARGSVARSAQGAGVRLQPLLAYDEECRPQLGATVSF
jgi:hypothetical protein